MKKRADSVWMYIFALLLMALTSCSSSRLSPNVGVGVPMQKGQAPVMNVHWF